MSLMHRRKWSTLPPGLSGGEDERCGHGNREHGHEDGLAFACGLDGKGGGRTLDWAGDEIANRLSESMNRTMYALSMVAGVFLPLGFLTGLLGINVGGMPGVDSGSAFWITCALLVLLGIGEVALFRRMKWL